MTGRERVKAALDHRETDRVPRLLYGGVIGYVPAIEHLLNKKCAPLSPREYFKMDLTGLEPNPTRLNLDRFAPHVLGAETPWDNINAFFEAAEIPVH